MSTIPDQLTLILAGLRAVIAAFMARRETVPVVWIGARAFAAVPAKPRHAPVPLPLWTLLHQRLHQTAHRFQALFERWRAATLPRPAPRPASAGSTAARPPAPRLPRGRAWIVARIGHHAAAHASQLDHLLADPAMPEFLAAAPQAGRLLRPLCHALGIDQPAWLRLPPRPRTPRPRTPRPRPPAPRTSPARPAARPLSFAAALRAIPPDRPLQPYVLAAARASRKTRSD